MKALPCRLQNDSPPQSLNGSHLDRNVYLNDATDSEIDSSAVNNRSVHNNGIVIKSARMPDEMAYVNLNKIVEDECDVLANELQGGHEAMANGAMHRSVDTNIAHYASESETNNAYDNTNNSSNSNKLSNFYMQVMPPPPPPPLPPPPPTLIAWNNNSGDCAVKSIVSTPNQKTNNNFSNGTAAPINSLYTDNGNGNTPSNNGNEYGNMSVMHSGDNNINSHMNANNKSTFAHCTNNAMHGKHIAHSLN